MLLSVQQINTGCLDDQFCFLSVAVRQLLCLAASYCFWPKGYDKNSEGNTKLILLLSSWHKNYTRNIASCIHHSFWVILNYFMDKSEYLNIIICGCLSAFHFSLEIKRDSKGAAEDLHHTMKFLRIFFKLI